jgi:hypothetical protein
MYGDGLYSDAYFRALLFIIDLSKNAGYFWGKPCNTRVFESVFFSSAYYSRIVEGFAWNFHI